MAPRPAFSYLLPIRRERPAAEELGAYIGWLAARGQVIIVDGSPSEVFDRHRSAWGGLAMHVPPAPNIPALNGKVRGVLTGLSLARHEALIIADDDVRYDEESLAGTLARLERAHVVRPQNYFDPLPWHARWDSGRILLNRALDGDWPGTLAVRRSALLVTRGYSGDVLFENLELVRTIVAAGGTESVAREVLVRRVPPDAGHFWSQRVRQAYDEFARPRRLAAQLALLPALLALALSGRWLVLVTLAAAVMAVAEAGRRRDGGRRVFPPTAPLYSPAWVLERAACAWLAVIARLRAGGVSYSRGVIARAATPLPELLRRHAGAISSTSIGLNEPLFESSAEQAVTPTT